MTKSLYDPEVEKKGKLDGVRETIIIFLVTKFSKIPKDITQKIQSQNDLDVLNEWFVKVVKSNSLSEVEEIIIKNKAI